MHPSVPVEIKAKGNEVPKYGTSSSNTGGYGMIPVRTLRGKIDSRRVLHKSRLVDLRAQYHGGCQRQRHGFKQILQRVTADQQEIKMLSNRADKIGHEET